MRRRRSYRILLGPAFAAVLLGLLEISLRLAGVQPAYRSEELGSWRFVPDLSQKVMQGPRDGHSFTVSTNTDGLRTALPKEHGEKYRIALMGDSTVFGWGVNDGQTIAEGMQAALPTVEVLNAGQPGYSTTMVSWLFRKVIFEYKPDLLIVFIPMHDSNRVLVSDREVLSGGVSIAEKGRVWLAQESRMYSLLRKLLFPNTDRAFLMPMQSGTEPRVPRVSDAERSLAMEEMRLVLTSWNGQLAVGYLPFKGDIEDGAPPERPTSAWAREYGARARVPVVALQRCCVGEKGLVLVDDPGHLSEEGNRRVGEALAEEFSRSLRR